MLSYSRLTGTFSQNQMSEKRLTGQRLIILRPTLIGWVGGLIVDECLTLKWRKLFQICFCLFVQKGGAPELVRVSRLLLESKKKLVRVPFFSANVGRLHRGEWGRKCLELKIVCVSQRKKRQTNGKDNKRHRCVCVCFSGKIPYVLSKPRICFFGSIDKIVLV